MPFAHWKGTPFEIYILPIIPAGAKISAHSKLTPDKLGKLPGKRASDGWVGFHGWQQHHTTAADLDRWAKWYGDNPQTVGYQLGDQIVIDGDVADPELARKIVAAAYLTLGPAPMRFRANSSKFALFYQLDHERAGAFVHKSRLAFQKGDETHAVEILGKGEQFVIEGLHPSGVEHQWDTHPLEFGPLTRVTGHEVASFLQFIQPTLAFHKYEIVKARVREGAGRGETYPIGVEHPERCADLDQLAEVLTLLPASHHEFESYDQFIMALCAIKTACAGDHDFYTGHVIEWAATVEDNMRDDGDWLDAKWESFQESAIGWAYLCNIAHDYGFVGDAASEFEALPADGGEDDAAGAGPILPTDLQGVAADTFVEWHENDRRVIGGGRLAPWLKFEDGVWQEHKFALYDVRKVCEAVAKPISRSPGRQAMQRVRSLYLNSTYEAIERMLRSDPRLCVQPDQLDAQPFVIGVPGGYIDEEGKLREPDPSRYITHRLACVPSEAEWCPMWKTRLMELCDGDQDRYECLRSWFGYALSGSAAEQAFLFMLGDKGGEGKTTFLEILLALFGGYGAAVDYHAFIARSENRFQLGHIRGARLMVASETNDGDVWADAKLKEMTGSGRVLIEQKYQMPMTVLPTWALTFAGNRMPEFRHADPALARRMIVVSCMRPIPKDEQDKQFSAYIRAHEQPGVARWCVNSMVEYQRRGSLIVPASVQKVSDEFFEEEDKIGQFIAEDTVKVSEFFTTTEDVMTRFDAFAARTGTKQMSEKRLIRAMLSHSLLRGCVTRTTRRVDRGEGRALRRGLVGLKLSDGTEQTCNV